VVFSQQDSDVIHKHSPATLGQETRGVGAIIGP